MVTIPVMICGAPVEAQRACRIEIKSNHRMEASANALRASGRRANQYKAGDGSGVATHSAPAESEVTADFARSGLGCGEALSRKRSTQRPKSPHVAESNHGCRSRV